MSVVNGSINTRHGFMLKYIVGKNQKHLIVSEKTHAIVKLYAKQNGLTMVGAVHKLLRMAFAEISGVDLDDESGA